MLRSLLIQMERLKESYQDSRRYSEMTASIEVVHSRLARNPWTKFLAQAVQHVTVERQPIDFVRLRRVIDALAGLQQRCELMLKVVRSLEIEYENSENHETPEKGSGSTEGQL
jgi:hypothetical protein